ncbi:MAG: VOC family protein [Ignavibacteriaceae bacterium]
MEVKPIPDGYNSITPYVIVKDVSKLIAFLKEAFDAELIFSSNKDGKISHADLLIGNSHLMLGEANEEWKSQPTMLYLYVENTDEVFNKALKAGGVSIMQPEDKFYGDRNGILKDPSGNSWCIATHVEDVSPEELENREKEQKN